MHIATIKISLRVLAFIILALLVYSIYDIAVTNSLTKSAMEQGILFFAIPDPYELNKPISVLVTALFALLTYGLVKLNKSSKGWRQLNMEIYMCLFVGLLHILLCEYQSFIFYPSF